MKDFFLIERNDHITGERLLDMALNPEQTPSEQEEAHLDDCPQCLKRLIEFIKRAMES
jgi:hypothetical protein